MSAYRSSVLRCQLADQDCPICRFLDGELVVPDLLYVISVLDAALAEEEELSKIWQQTLASLVNKDGSLKSVPSSLVKKGGCGHLKGPW